MTFKTTMRAVLKVCSSIVIEGKDATFVAPASALAATGQFKTESPMKLSLVFDLNQEVIVEPTGFVSFLNNEGTTLHGYFYFLSPVTKEAILSAHGVVWERQGEY